MGAAKRKPSPSASRISAAHPRMTFSSNRTRLGASPRGPSKRSFRMTQGAVPPGGEECRERVIGRQDELGRAGCQQFEAC